MSIHTHSIINIIVHHLRFIFIQGERANKTEI